MVVDTEEVKCNAVANKSGSCEMEFSNDTMKDKVSVVSIEV